ncbi:lipopolysaccharide biosynthesis protein [Aliarcobacter vitoriensis]|uniref:Lipopolysaccharide biosynthesis protein n=1 Tax=Aliarcobacter vitoriensis TaxID=2011099 RepID=A0A366MTP4_9BACT|nr:lipopolysaccharide biosynthesis protein [Aliarcobacter vitoriensis]RBQ29233.1 lipopolysaccharide biosynthesis protein [Aliarcobacter vitoriensis]
MNIKLKEKTVLFLAPNFFGYEIEIKKKLENFGAKVIYFDERPKNDFFTKAFIRLNLKSIISKRIEDYYKNIVEATKYENIDYLFLIAPETISIKTIVEIKSIHQNIKIFSYFWDSIKNKKTSLDYLDISDKYFTFDSSDTNIDKKIKFLPLFYIKNYENIADTKNELVYDICFIGTVHSDRYKIIKELGKQLKGTNINTSFYFYSPSKILFFFQKLLKKDFRNIKWSEVSFKPLSKSDVIDIIKKSKCIIDIQHPNQTGLTMRTIEILGAKKKLLTTNKEIEKYDFYNKNNIFVFDRNKPKICPDFLIENYEDIDIDIYQKYSLENWIKTIFKGNINE